VPTLPRPDATPEATRIAVFGGVYSITWPSPPPSPMSAAARSMRSIAWATWARSGRHPDRSVELLRENAVLGVRGNYDDSIGNDLADCQCGYTDPRDNHFARISYDYTLRSTGPANRACCGNCRRSAASASGVIAS